MNKIEIKKTYDVATLLELFDHYYDEFCLNRYSKEDELGGVVRYVLEGKGKRVRALLCLLCANAVMKRPFAALPAALAIEMLHAYSLIHDDLPCMDNDDLRRGRPTAHKKYNDAYAVLAGDALLTDAFHVLTEDVNEAFIAGSKKERGDWKKISPARKLMQVQELSLAAGSYGMVSGQIMDMYWTARVDIGQHNLDDLNKMHRKKTGCLIAASCALGALAGEGAVSVIESFRDFGFELGLAFQIKDDLLDNSDKMGKTSGKDEDKKKLTYLTLMTRDEAEKKAKEYTDHAISILNDLKKREIDTDVLISYSLELMNRHF